MGIMKSSDTIGIITFEGGIAVQTFETKLEAVKRLLNNGSLGNNSFCWGSEEHKSALKEIARYVKQIQESIEQEEQRQQEPEGD